MLSSNACTIIRKAVIRLSMPVNKEEVRKYLVRIIVDADSTVSYYYNASCYL